MVTGGHMEITNINKGFFLSLEREIYRRSYYEFFKKAFEVLHPGEPYSDNWHIKLLCDRLQKELVRIKKREVRKKDLIINVPFRSAKSLITTIVFPVWCWTVDARIKFITTSYSEPLALEHAQRSRDLINTEWFKERWGSRVLLRSDLNAKGFYATVVGGYRKSVGLGGAITGSGADIIICDDGQNPKKAASAVERQNAKDFWNHTLYSRLNQLEIGVRINIQQRLHEDDITGSLMSENSSNYELIRIPAQLTTQHQPHPLKLKSYYDEDGLFWSSRFSQSVIDNYKKVLGSLQTAGQLQQSPMDEEGNLFKRDWFDIVDGNLLERDYNDSPLMFYIDTADTEKQQNDPYAIITTYKKDNVVYVLDVVEKWMSFPEACKFIVEYVNKMGYSQASKIKIEPKTAGKSIVSQLKAVTMLNVMELDSSSDDKVTRAASISASCEARRVRLINGGYLENFLQQLTTFPNAKHDDMVDVFIYSVTDLLLSSDFDFAFI